MKLTRIDAPAKKKDTCTVCSQDIEETIFMGRPLWNHTIQTDLARCIELGCIGNAKPTGGR